MISAEKTSLPGLIEQRRHSQTELYGFEVDMSGRVIVPEFHPPIPDQVRASMNFQSELLVAINAAG